MTPEHYEQVCRLFDAVRQQPARERAAYLVETCPDPQLRAEVEQFLADDEAVGRDGFLAAPCPLDLREAFHQEEGVAEDLQVGRRVGPYEIERRIAHGAMGVVYQARQVELNRTVALKMILAGRLASPADVERFRIEAEAAALLDHPSIVPIYEVGEHEGLPYFSMKFMEGGSLAGAARSPRGAADDVAAVARAVHHAHQRGLLHRDLKPGNILLDRDGQPHVSDFGLAKRLDAVRSLNPSGAIVGTPSYMAPEQARAEKGITTAADVYALGAILYELLTGRPPFRGETVLDTLEQVVSRQPPRPRTLNPRVGSDLETICLKCLEKAPARRYASAEALADDLERFLAGEPIQARPVRSLERLYRWGRRNPRVAGLSAALILLFAGSFAVVTYLWLLAEARGAAIQREKDVAERLHDQIETTLGQTLGTMNSFQGISEQLRQKPERGALETRKKMVEMALKNLEVLRGQYPENPRVLNALGSAWLTRCRACRDLGLLGEVEESAREAIRIFERLVRDNPRGARYRVGLSHAYEFYAGTESDLQEKRRAQLRAMELRRQSVEEEPEDRWGLSALASSLHNEGLHEHRNGRRAEAVSYVQQACDLRERIDAKWPTWTDNLRYLAHGYTFLASLRRPSAEAVQLMQRACAVRERLARENPEYAQVQLELADAYTLLGEIHSDPKDVLSYNEKARDVLERLLDRLNREYLVPFQRPLAEAHYNVGLGQMMSFKLAEARLSFQRVCDLCEKLVLLHPEDARLWYWLGTSVFYLRLPKNLIDVRLEESWPVYEKAITALEKAVSAAPEQLHYRMALAKVLHFAGLYLDGQGQHDEAAAVFQRAVTHLRSAPADHPRDSERGRWLDSHLKSLAQVQRKRGRPAEAAAVARERRQLWPGDKDQLYRAAGELALCVPLVGKDTTEATASHLAERARYADEAMEALRQAVRRGFADLEQIQKDDALDPLRSREDFRKLLSELERQPRKEAK